VNLFCEPSLVIFGEKPITAPCKMLWYADVIITHSATHLMKTCTASKNNLKNLKQQKVYRLFWSLLTDLRINIKSQP